MNVDGTLFRQFHIIVPDLNHVSGRFFLTFHDFLIHKKMLAIPKIIISRRNHFYRVILFIFPDLQSLNGQ